MGRLTCGSCKENHQQEIHHLEGLQPHKLRLRACARLGTSIAGRRMLDMRSSIITCPGHRADGTLKADKSNTQVPTPHPTTSTGSRRAMFLFSIRAGTRLLPPDSDQANLLRGVGARAFRTRRHASRVLVLNKLCPGGFGVLGLWHRRQLFAAASELPRKGAVARVFFCGSMPEAQHSMSTGAWRNVPKQQYARLHLHPQSTCIFKLPDSTCLHIGGNI